MNSLHHADSAVKSPRTPTPSANGSGIPIIVMGRTSGFFMPATLTYYRRIDGSKHLLKKPLAITNDVAALATAKDMGATRVRIVDAETGSEYTASLQLIHEYGFHINRGHGQQIALPLGYWVKSDAHGNVFPATLPKAAPGAAVEPEAQPALFDMPAERKGGAY